jgi:hypothetical protein
MKQTLPRYRLLILGAALLVPMVFLNLWSVHALLIEKMPETSPLFMQQVRPGDSLGMGFLHSVENCHIWDYLQINDDYSMVVVATEFAESRTGLPYAAFEGEIFERKGGNYRISNMHRPVPEIWQWVDSKYQNTLKINGSQVIRLASLAGDTTLLHIRIVELNALKWAWLKAKILQHHRSD